MKLLYLESFCGGSHESVALEFARRSGHEVTVASLPPRFWKWRMRGAALHFARQLENLSAYDGILATDMLDLADFRALTGPSCPPVALYFHENQLSYPLAPGEKRDFHLGFTNIVSAHVADLVLFNSAFHRDEFMRAAQTLIRQMPDFRPSFMLDGIQAKSSVLYPGCPVPAELPQIGERSGDPPLVIWNHRWEHDKDPETFFRVMERIRNRGIAFRLAVLGERYGNVPKVFDTVDKVFREELAAFGFESDAAAYKALLSQGTCVVSTAVQENFGISVMEAAASGCFPLLPRRLSYPELIPEAFHSQVLYRDESDFEAKLAAVLTQPSRFLEARRALAAQACRFSWDHLIRDWDRRLAQLGSF